MEATSPPSSQKADASAVLGIPPENSWPYALWVADSWMSELKRLNKKRHKKLRANQEVLIFNGQNFLSLSKSLVTQLSKFQKCKHEKHHISRKKDLSFSIIFTQSTVVWLVFIHSYQEWLVWRQMCNKTLIHIYWMTEWMNMSFNLGPRNYDSRNNIITSSVIIFHYDYSLEMPANSCEVIFYCIQGDCHLDRVLAVSLGWENQVKVLNIYEVLRSDWRQVFQCRIVIQ